MKKSVKRKKRVVLSKAELENIRWFSKLSLTNKLAAIEEQIKTIHYGASNILMGIYKI